jgi:hypothetical protein
MKIQNHLSTFNSLQQLDSSSQAPGKQQVFLLLERETSSRFTIKMYMLNKYKSTTAGTHAQPPQMQ